jgi:hypothetical protein
MMSRLSRWLVLPFAVIVIASLSLHAQQSKWPTVQPLHITRTFVHPGADKKDIPFVAPIKSRAGVSLYRIECHNGNYTKDSEINYSGDFQCALFALKGSETTSRNLLAANTPNEQSTDWWNRGRLRSAQLRGECLRYPEYSTDRHFKLRGMMITLRFSDIEWTATKDQQNNPLESFKFTLDVVPDAEARSPEAEPPPGQEPPRSCYP